MQECPKMGLPPASRGTTGGAEAACGLTTDRIDGRSGTHIGEHHGVHMKTVSLPPNHYAATWSTEDVFSLEEASKLGYDYAVLPDGPEKEAKFLDIARTFHGYLIKYLFMICRGHLPLTFAGSKSASHVNTDTKRFVQYFLKKGVKFSRSPVMMVCRSPHLASKGMGTEELQIF
jgi:hypothetical protein